MNSNTKTLRWFFFIWLALISAAPGYTNTNSFVKIRPAGIRVVAPGFGDEQPRPFNCSSGMEIDLLVEATNSSIVDFDAKNSLVNIITDDKGAVLLQKQGSFTLNPAISADGKRSVISLNCSHPPSAGSKHISVNGFLKLEIGTKLSTVEVKDAPLVEGALQAAGMKLSVKKVGKTSWGKPGTELQLRFEGPTAPKISSVSFYTNEERIPATITTGYSGARYYFKNPADVDSIYRDFRFILPQETAAATVRVEYWSETETREVPFSFVTGIGL